MDFENFVASIVREKFQQFDEESADAREQQGIAQVGLGTRPMSDRPGLAKEEDEAKVEKISTATRVLSDMSDYYQPDEFPTQEVRVDNAPRFSNINRSTVLDILSANRDGLEKQGIIKMPMGMLRQPDPTLDIDGLQSRILDRLDLRTPEGSAQDIQYGAELGKLGEFRDDEDQPDMSAAIDAPAGEAQDNQPNLDDRPGLGARPPEVEVTSITMDAATLEKEFVKDYLAPYEGKKDHKHVEKGSGDYGNKTLAYGIKRNLGLNRDNYDSDAAFAAAVAMEHYVKAEKNYSKNPKGATWSDLGKYGRYAVLDLQFNAGTIGDTAKFDSPERQLKNTLEFVGMTTKKDVMVSVLSLAERRAKNWNKAADDLGLTKIAKIQHIPTKLDGSTGTTFKYLDANDNEIYSFDNGRIAAETLYNSGEIKALEKLKEVSL
jgi:hypothetical protein